jgi:hypothetical protein
VDGAFRFEAKRLARWSRSRLPRARVDEQQHERERHHDDDAERGPIDVPFAEGAHEHRTVTRELLAAKKRERDREARGAPDHEQRDQRVDHDERRVTSALAVDAANGCEQVERGGANENRRQASKREDSKTRARHAGSFTRSRARVIVSEADFECDRPTAI